MTIQKISMLAVLLRIVGLLGLTGCDDDKKNEPDQTETPDGSGENDKDDDKDDDDDGQDEDRDKDDKDEDEDEEEDDPDDNTIAHFIMTQEEFDNSEYGDPAKYKMTPYYTINSTRDYNYRYCQPWVFYEECELGEANITDYDIYNQLNELDKLVTFDFESNITREEWDKSTYKIDDSYASATTYYYIAYRDEWVVNRTDLNYTQCVVYYNQLHLSLYTHKYNVYGDHSGTILKLGRTTNSVKTPVIIYIKD